MFTTGCQCRWRFVEGHEHAIGLKAQIMVDHFHEQIIAQRKIDGQARAMVVTNGINPCLTSQILSVW